MVSLSSLWLPIVLATIGVFLASTLIHMLLKWHASDYKQMPNEDAIRAAIRAGNPEPRQYVLPWCAEMSALKTEEMQRKYLEGPVAIVQVGPNRLPAMGAAFGGWIVFILVVSIVVAYVGAAALPRGTAYLKVFQVTGTVAWLAYAAGQVPASIWMMKPWSITSKDVLDGLIYALVTAGVFGWRWPQ